MLRTSWCFVIFLVAHVPLFSQSDSTARIRLIFAGDIMGHGPQITAATLDSSKGFDYNPCFQFVAPTLEDADFAIGNLELTLPGKPPYTGYPTFRSPNALAPALRKAGFDLLVTSNNHSNDAGLNGIQQTIKTLQANGFYQTGTFADSLSREALYPLLVYKGVFKLAFLNYTYGTNGIPTPKPAVVNLIDEKSMQADLAVARQLEPDFIIVLVHWGNEYQLNESPQQSQLAKKLFEWGADLIVGSHPHVIQPIKEIGYKRPEQDSAKGIVAFSLGNFISAQKQSYTDMGLLFEVTLEKKTEEKGAYLTDQNYIPVFRYIHRDISGKSQYYTIPVSYLEGAVTDLPFKIPSDSTLRARQTAASIRKQLNRYAGKERTPIAMPRQATTSNAAGSSSKN